MYMVSKVLGDIQMKDFYTTDEGTVNKSNKLTKRTSANTKNKTDGNNKSLDDLVPVRHTFRIPDDDIV